MSDFADLSTTAISLLQSLFWDDGIQITAIKTLQQSAEPDTQKEIQPGQLITIPGLAFLQIDLAITIDVSHLKSIEEETKRIRETATTNPLRFRRHRH